MSTRARHRPWFAPRAPTMYEIESAARFEFGWDNWNDPKVIEREQRDNVFTRAIDDTIRWLVGERARIERLWS